MIYERRSVKLEEICTNITDGKHGDCKHEDKSGFYFISCKDVSDGKVNYENARQITEADFVDTHRRTRLEPNDILITNSGTIGRMAIVPDNNLTRRTTFQKSVAILKPIPDEVEPRFLYYHLQSDLRRLTEFAGGTAQKNLLLRDLRAFTIELPPLSVQCRIAGILSAYDELIENNQRRIKILEEMARSLYREWFVLFRFPGHDKVKMVPSPLGPIPQGWHAIRFDELLTSMTGGDWGSDRPTENETAEVGIVRGTDFTEVAYGGELRMPVRYIKLSSLKTRGLCPGDIIVENSINAKSRCVGTTLLVDKQMLSRMGGEAVAASFCKVFRLHEPKLAPLVHLHMRHLREESRMEYYQNVAANGIGNFQAQRFAQDEYLVLPVGESLRAKLLENIGALTRGIGLLSSQLSNLRRTRDLLLTRLLSGQINVTSMKTVA